jgi:hypothetical protein
MSRDGFGYKYNLDNTTDGNNRYLEITGASWGGGGGPFAVDDLVYNSVDYSQFAVVTWVDPGNDRHIYVVMLSEGSNFANGVNIETNGAVDILQNLAVTTPTNYNHQAFQLYQFLKRSLTTWEVEYRAFTYSAITWVWNGGGGYWENAAANPAWDYDNERNYILLTCLLPGYEHYQVCIAMPEGRYINSDEAIAPAYRDTAVGASDMQISLSFNINPTYDFQGMYGRLYRPEGGSGTPPLYTYPWNDNWWSGFWYDPGGGSIWIPGTFEAGWEPFPTGFWRLHRWYRTMADATLYFIEDDSVPHLTVYCKRQNNEDTSFFSCGSNHIVTTWDPADPAPYKPEGAFCGYGNAGAGSVPALEMLTYTWSNSGGKRRDGTEDVDFTLIDAAVNSNMPNPFTGKYLTTNLMRMTTSTIYGEWNRQSFRSFGLTTETFHNKIGDDPDYQLMHFFQRVITPWDNSLPYP